MKSVIQKEFFRNVLCTGAITVSSLYSTFTELNVHHVVAFKKKQTLYSSEGRAESGYLMNCECVNLQFV